MTVRKHELRDNMNTFQIGWGRKTSNTLKVFVADRKLTKSNNSGKLLTVTLKASHRLQVLSRESKDGLAVIGISMGLFQFFVFAFSLLIKPYFADPLRNSFIASKHYTKYMSKVEEHDLKGKENCCGHSAE